MRPSKLRGPAMGALATKAFVAARAVVGRAPAKPERERRRAVRRVKRVEAIMVDFCSSASSEFLLDNEDSVVACREGKVSEHCSCSAGREGKKERKADAHEFAL